MEGCRRGESRRVGASHREHERRMTDDERRGLDLLTHHADRLDRLVRVLGDPVRVVRTALCEASLGDRASMRQQAGAAYRTITNAVAELRTHTVETR